MDEKITPADVIRKAVDAVADAENNGLTVEKDENTSFELNVDDDAIEFSSFSIDDNRDTTPGSKAGTRLPTVSLPSAKIMEAPAVNKDVATAETIRVELPEEYKTGTSALEEPETPKVRRHSKTWERNHRASEEADVASDAVKKEAPKGKLSQEELLAEIMAATPEERKRREAAKEEGRKLAEGIFAEESSSRNKEATVSQATKIIDTDEIDTLAALERFEQSGKREPKQRVYRHPDADEGIDISSNTQPIPPQDGKTGGYFGVGQQQNVYMNKNAGRKSGFTTEATAAAGGSHHIQSQTPAVDPSTLSKKELKEYNRIARKGAAEQERLEKKAAKRAGKKRMKVWQKVLIILLALVFLLVALAAIFFNRYYGLLGKLDITGDNPVSKISTSEQSKANQETFNILLVGLDSRKDNYTGRSDSMILCTINKSSKKFVMTSFLRDSYLDIPGHGKDKLNAAYAYGGSSLLTQTIYNNYGIVVDRTAVFNFIFVIDVIDYLGGVTVEVTQEELPYLNMYIHDQNEELYKSSNPNQGQITTGPGTYNLTGNQALAYARIRYVGTDFARSERQRLVLSECLDKAQKLSAGELNKMATTFLPRIKTDLTQGDCASLILTLLRAGNYEMQNMAIPIDGTWSDATVGDQEVLKISDLEANTEAWEKMVS